MSGMFLIGSCSHHDPCWEMLQGRSWLINTNSIVVFVFESPIQQRLWKIGEINIMNSNHVFKLICDNFGRLPQTALTRGIAGQCWMNAGDEIKNKMSDVRIPDVKGLFKSLGDVSKNINSEDLVKGMGEPSRLPTNIQRRLVKLLTSITRKPNQR